MEEIIILTPLGEKKPKAEKGESLDGKIKQLIAEVAGGILNQPLAEEILAIQAAKVAAQKARAKEKKLALADELLMCVGSKPMNKDMIYEAYLSTTDTPEIKSAVSAGTILNKLYENGQIKCGTFKGKKYYQTL